MEISYKDWIAARDRIAAAIPGPALSPMDTVARITTAALGPMPPEPAPEPFCIADDLLVSALKTRVEIPGFWLTPDQADAMALALTEHAAYARRQETPKEPICGHTLTRSESNEGIDAICQRPKGHDDFCKHMPLEEK